MFRKYIWSLFFLILVTGISASILPETISVKNSVDMRNGPGSYYKLILRLKPGAEVSQMDQKQQWLKVKAKNEVGWIPERAADHEKQTQKENEDEKVNQSAQDAFDELSGEEQDTTGDPYASRAQVAAAVKGFAEDFTSKKTQKQKADLLQNFDGFINPVEYEQFRKERLQNWSWQKAQSRIPIETSEAPTLDPLKEQVGWGIANVIAQQGLIKNKEVQQYLTHIALVVAENSHRYETPVQVYILDKDNITGYASPNGAIFVSKGALQLMKNEAEFAFFVAHELAHIVHSHGAKESAKRETKIKAEKAFEELDQQVGEREKKYKKAEAELTKWANEMYEYTVKDRLEEYEFQADYWGIAYTYRAGYNPIEGLEFLQRILNQQGDFEQKTGMAKWEGASLQKRIKKFKKEINLLNVPEDFGHTYENAFGKKLQELW